MNTPTKIATGATVALVAVAAFSLLRNQQEQTDSTSDQSPEMNSSTSTSTKGDRVLAKGRVVAIGHGADMARQIRTVFVILRGDKPGPPYAVKKLKNTAGENSLDFELTAADVMIPGRPEPANPVLKIRYDSDTNPTTELPTDVVGEIKSFQIGDVGLKVEADLVSNRKKDSL